MIQLTEEQSERLKQIRERKQYQTYGHCGSEDCRPCNARQDAQFLLSLLDSDSQAAGAARQLAFAIESAAAKAGILEARQHALTGPQLLML